MMLQSEQAQNDEFLKENKIYHLSSYEAAPDALLTTVCSWTADEKASDLRACCILLPVFMNAWTWWNIKGYSWNVNSSSESVKSLVPLASDIVLYFQFKS